MCDPKCGIMESTGDGDDGHLRMEREVGDRDEGEADRASDESKLGADNGEGQHQDPRDKT